MLSTDFSPRANTGARSGNFQLSPIKAMELAAARIPGAVSLAQGIPSFETPAAIKDFVIEKLRAGLVDKYSLTIGLSELREEIAVSMQRDGLHYDPDREIIITAGSIQGITASILATIQPGDEVLVPSPTYASYLGAIGVARGTPQFFELDEDRNFDFHVERIARAITPRTKMILYCSPNNPTGTLFSEKNTRALLDLAESHNLTVLIDEVYKDFYYSDDKHFTPCSVPEARGRVIRVCSFSKAYAMTGWRVGFVHGDASRIQPILKYHDAMVTCAPVISQYGAIAALRFGEQYLSEFRAEFKRRRDFTIQELDRMSHALDYQLPKATYFVFPRIKDIVPMARDSTRLAYDILEKAKLALVPGVAFGPSGEQHLRISYGREWADLKEGLTRLEEYLARSLGEKRTRLSHSTSPRAAPPTPFMKRLTQYALGSAARLWIHRNRPEIVAVVGLRGKTVLKRTLVEALQRIRATRGSVLSYNTALGLPLSVLNLPIPLTPRARLQFIPKLLAAALRTNATLPDSQRELLVLEYGVESVEDARALARIAPPDWLIISELGGGDPGVDIAGIRAGIIELSKRVPPERILWPLEDPWLQEANLKLEKHNALSLESLQGTQLVTSAASYQVTREIVGQSALRGVLAAVRLMELMQAAPTLIDDFLGKNRSYAA